MSAKNIPPITAGDDPHTAATDNDRQNESVSHDDVVVTVADGVNLVSQADFENNFGFDLQGSPIAGFTFQIRDSNSTPISYTGCFGAVKNSTGQICTLDTETGATTPPTLAAGEKCIFKTKGTELELYSKI